MLQYKKKFLEKWVKPIDRGLKALEYREELKRRREICQDIQNGIIFKQKKEKQMPQEEKYSQN
jgi:hypothetical protein